MNGKSSSHYYIIKILIILIYYNFCALSLYAQIDTIHLGDHQLNTNSLKPGLKQYLVYFQDPKKSKSITFTLWLRDISFSTKNGEKVININQHWFSEDSTGYRSFFSVNKRSDFEPVYHQETIRGKTKAYNWSTNKITGADSVVDNVQKGFALMFKIPNFNWNLDIETFEMLPLAEGETFVINFYDAGLSAPEYINYKVIGSEIITTLDSQTLDCWKLYTEGKLGNGSLFSETFWISKKGHEFLKEEDQYNGMFRYKIKMIGATPDLLKIFKN